MPFYWIWPLPLIFKCILLSRRITFWGLSPSDANPEHPGRTEITGTGSMVLGMMIVIFQCVAPVMTVLGDLGLLFIGMMVR